MQSLTHLMETVDEKETMLKCGASTEAFQLSPLSARQSRKQHFVRDLVQDTTKHTLNSIGIEHTEKIQFGVSDS